MSTSQNQNSDIKLSSFDYSLGRSIVGRAFIALAILAATLGVACVFWEHKDLAALFATAWIVVRGLSTAWSILPFSPERRSRWARNQDLYKAHPAYQYCSLFWAGFGVLILNLWQLGPKELFSFDALVVPGIGIVIGAGCYVFSRLSVAHT